MTISIFCEGHSWPLKWLLTFPDRWFLSVSHSSSFAINLGSVGPALVATPMQILGALEAFDPSTDTVSAYVERAELFFTVNNIAAEKKVPVFLNAVGKQQYQLISNLCLRQIRQ